MNWATNNKIKYNIFLKYLYVLLTTKGADNTLPGKVGSVKMIEGSGKTASVPSML
jgi:hypothetical protein